MKKITIAFAILLLVISVSPLSFAKGNTVLEQTTRFEQAVTKAMANAYDQQCAFEQEEEKLDKQFELFKRDFPLEVEPKFENLNKKQQAAFYKLFKARMDKYPNLESALPTYKIAQYMEKAKVRHAYICTVLQQEFLKKLESKKAGDIIRV